MTETKYSIGGQFWRFQGIYLALCFLGLLFLLPYIEPEFKGSVTVFIVIIYALVFYGCINLWLQPIIRIEEDGLLIIRLGIVKRKVKWNNIILQKKIRTLTRFSLIGIDPRYVVIKIKDGTFIDNRIAILSFFKGYDIFVKKIEEELKSEDVISDMRYR